MIDYASLSERFKALYGGDPRLFRAPGRVNLIGEHTDYNGGFVLPIAIDLEAVVAISPRTDTLVRIHAANFDEDGEFDFSQPFVGTPGHWSNLPEGMARVLQGTGAKLSGADMMIIADVPGGAGLSSSAAVCVAVGLALTEISDAPIDRIELAKAAQQTEHDYAGAKVGIMDQFVSAHAEPGHALLLDCRSLEYDHVPFLLADNVLVICDTNVKHELAASAYNTRRAECEEAVQLLRADQPDITQLRDVSFSDFERSCELLPSPIRSRARHVITENERTLAAAEALKKGDLHRFGQLMFRSHASLRDDYEVSCKELDVLVDAATELGALGSRMTGGGFGGSTVNLLKRSGLDNFCTHISQMYAARTGLQATIIITESRGGASEVGCD
ncbi:MAG: galactokinase [Blastocatellia bacterium]|nr:galactokinase [Blastocatellia bacterium]